MRDFASAHNDYLDPDRHLPELEHDEGEDSQEMPAFPCASCGSELEYEDPESDIGKPGRWWCPICEPEG